jgi:hypothetical protein
MSAENMGERKDRPTASGEMLRENFLRGHGLTVSSLARASGVARQSVNELLRVPPLALANPARIIGFARKCTGGAVGHSAGWLIRTT